MPVFRVTKTKDFSVMSNSHFKEKEMSLKAKGLLSLMLSLPDAWDYSIEGITTLSKDGKSSVMSAMKELEKFGFLKRTRTKSKNGKFKDVVYDVYENTSIKPKSDFPYMEKPNAGKPYAENQTQYNTKLLNTNESITKEIIYSDLENEFEIVWDLYPNKKGKESARKDFIKARKEGITIDSIEKGIKAYSEHIKNTKTETKFIKYGSTFFHQRSWEDSYEEINKNPRNFNGDREEVRDEDIFENYDSV